LTAGRGSGAPATTIPSSTTPPAGAITPPPTPTPAPTPAPASSTKVAAFAAREAAITPTMVAAQGRQGVAASGLFAVAAAAGFSRLRAAAMALSTVGGLSELDLTDALFVLVRPELHGGRIATGRRDLVQEWRMI